MEKQTYQGWTNYATWRVNLEMFDGCDLTDYGWQKLDKYDLAQEMKEYAEEFIELDCGKGLARDYALAFLQDVDEIQYWEYGGIWSPKVKGCLHVVKVRQPIVKDGPCNPTAVLHRETGFQGHYLLQLKSSIHIPQTLVVIAF
jgi:hypothetical protein